MIKGIYNENEFYTNHYWSSKFFDDLASKTQTIPDLKTRANTIKELGDQYWDLIEGKDASKVEHTEQFVQFFQNLLKVLGYSFDPKKRQTVEGLYYSVATEVKQDSKSHLLIALTESNESGSFESLPLELVKLNKEDDDEAEDRDLAEITSEELDSETGPKWFIVGAIDNLHLIQRGKWSYGRFIRVNLSEIFAQKDDKAYTTLLGLFSKEILAPESGLSIHEELDDNSHRHAFAVTTELREGVRESIELLINEMIYAKKEAHQEYLKKDKDADEYAKELTHDALFYVYRLIFLLFLESQGDDSELLPLKSEIYRHGYSLEKLLEIAFKQIHEGTQEYEGTFIQESLERIFDLIFNGFVPQRSGDFLTENLSSTGFLVKGLKSDLFDPGKVKHLKGVSLRNGVLQKMLQKLSMADIKEGKKTRKARVSYANLGINQLGAVYEGLLSYTGFFAKEDLYELTQVKKGKDDGDDSSEGDDESSAKATKVDPDKIYLAPKSLVEKYKKDKKYKLTDKHFVLDKETGEPVCYKKGSFIFRLSGKDRQKSASYYTPESLTKCTVKYALDVLFTKKTNLSELKNIKILEPAMGSGAFLNEAVNQLSTKILDLEIKSAPESLKHPKVRQKRLSEIKYDLISKNVFGVDMNPTAIELARFSLWLNCIGAGQDPIHLKRNLKLGNSLIGARFTKNADGIFPWMLLSPQMMDYGKKLSEYDNIGLEKINAYRYDLFKSQDEIDTHLLKSTQKLAENLYIDLTTDASNSSAYEKLKMCCDLWCSLFFLEVNDLSLFPSTANDLLKYFYETLTAGIILNTTNLRVREISMRERFFHWELEFPKEISTGGFDLILGNPPWIALEWHENANISSPIPQIFEFDAKTTADFIQSNLGNQELRTLASNYISYTGQVKYLETPFYKLLKGISKNTYKSFIVLSTHLAAKDSAIGLIHEDGVYEDQKGEALREHLYKKLYYHFSFVNQKYLFSEIGNTRAYSVNILGPSKSDINFIHIGNLFLPATIEASFSHRKLDTSDRPPGIKNNKHEWETTGHQDRLILINASTLSIFSQFNNANSNFPPLLNLHSKQLLDFISAIASSTKNVGEFLGSDVIAGGMLEAKSSLKNEIIFQKNVRPKKLNEVVLTAPQFFNFSPFGQETTTNYKNHRSYIQTDLETCDSKWVPRVLFAQNNALVNDSIKSYQLNLKSYLSYYRLGYRRRFDVQSERCFYPGLIPPGVSHIDLIESLATTDLKKTLLLFGYSTSLTFDFIARVKNLKDCRFSELKRFPINPESNFSSSIIKRAVKLSAPKHFYSFSGLIDDALLVEDTFSIFSNYKEEEFINTKSLLDFQSRRELISCEIDALVLLSLDLSIDIYASLYDTLMPVLRKYDQQAKFDRIAYVKYCFEFFKTRGY